MTRAGRSHYRSSRVNACSFFILGAAIDVGVLTDLQPPASSPPAPVIATSGVPALVTKDTRDIQPGDLVLARDEHGDEIQRKQVARVFRRTSDHLRILTFRASGGRRQTLKTTDEHPFWRVNGGRFVKAGDLEAGDTVTGPNGEIQHLLATHYEPHPYGVAVYNFEVEDYHTYYVSENGARAPPTLVHNADGYVPDGSSPRVYHGTDDASAKSIVANGLDPQEWRRAAGGAGPDPKGLSVTTDPDVARAWAEVRAAERGGKPVVIEAAMDDLPLKQGEPGDWTDPDEWFVDFDDFGEVGGGVFGEQ